MSEVVSWVLHLNVREGHLGSLKTLMVEMIESTRNEKGAQAYERERFLGCLEPTAFYVYGSPNGEVRKILDGFGAKYLGELGGFMR